MNEHARRYFLSKRISRACREASGLLAFGIFAAGGSFPAHAQVGGVESPQMSSSPMVIEEVIVNATRREESAQDVSVSLSVFSQKQLDEANITNPSDLATYTPSLQANNRFGGDNATFAIRGFSQELRTTASVGVYFAEVVAPRGSNAQQSGDGASPGDMFDLGSVQVLKGPQGTLFGRNTTGGAVLLMPKKPTDVLEGYVEVSNGNFDMSQEQVVVNVPVVDSLKVRFGVDHKERDGYLDNISGIGPKDFADVKYTSYRLGVLWDITDFVENYTIFKNTESDNNGYPGSVFACFDGAGFGALMGTLCKTDLEERAAAGQDGFYDIYNSVNDPVNEQKLSQIINTTTWQINDELILKNIISYATLETKQRSSLFGEHLVHPGFGNQIVFQQVGLTPSLPTTDQETWVEEVQVQGYALDNRLQWQAGLYYEKSEPGQDSGSQSPALLSCDQNSIAQDNPLLFDCQNTGSFGRLARLEGGVVYKNKAAYFQGTYDLNDVLSATLGLRYTNDETKGYVTETVWAFNGFTSGPPNDPFPTPEKRNPEVSSEEPTWLLGLDYKPADDTLLYAKYSRGYRQGSVNIAGSVLRDAFGNVIERYDTHEPEQVDTYEIGSKNQFEVPVPGTFNMAVFFNDFQNQQIQYGYFKPSYIGTTAITNAGKSTIWGIEADGTLMLPGNVILTASYSHLDTDVKELAEPTFDPSLYALLTPSTTTAEGEPLSMVPKNQFVGNVAWMVPVSPEIGDMKLAVTYVYTDEMQGVAKQYSILAVFPQYELWNLNYSWEAIFGSNFDFSAFVTNLKDEEYRTYIAGTYNNGLEAGAVGQPKMYGARIKYNFSAF